MSHTFELGLKIKPDLTLRTKLGAQIPAREAITRSLGGDVEQCSLPEGRIISVIPNLVGLAHTAFAEHYHMIVDPDMVWLSIEKGLAIHITENAEELRDKFVKHKGKKLIEIHRDQFIRGQTNDWEGCFDEFSEKIGEEIGAKRDLIVGNFSTTQKLQRVSSEIILMDAMSRYFDYGVQTMCSIPLVTLEGEVQDWESIRDRVRQFNEFGLMWWTDHLLPVLDQLIETAKGKPDLEFWKSWYKEDGGSGGPFIDGHVQKFFPYLDNGGTGYKKNELVHRSSGGFGGGPTMDAFVKGLSNVAFVWDYYGTMYPMEFVGGIIGIQQDPNGAVRGAFGWAVRDACVELTKFPIEKMVKDMVIHHTDGDVGVLKKAEAEQWGDKDRTLSDVTIEWKKRGLQTHGHWDFRQMFVKEASRGRPVSEGE